MDKGKVGMGYGLDQTNWVEDRWARNRGNWAWAKEMDWKGMKLAKSRKKERNGPP